MLTAQATKISKRDWNAWIFMGKEKTQKKITWKKGLEKKNMERNNMERMLGCSRKGTGKKEHGSGVIPYDKIGLSLPGSVLGYKYMVTKH